MAKILGVGIATLDIINTVDGYPAEDSEVRALCQRRCRGGNATNTLVVLSQLGHNCTWAGVLADEPDSVLVREELQAYHIDISPCRIVQDGKLPVSYITLNRKTGSRTIVHYRDLPEYDYQDFLRIDLKAFDWLHFEGRAVDETAQMITHAREQSPGLPISLEVEKPRPGIEHLFDKVEVLLFSRIYVQQQGYGGPREFLLQMQHKTAARLVCSWGEQGAYAIAGDGQVLHCPAHRPKHLVDTIGAGDTFNAAFISAQLVGHQLMKSLDFACHVAGVKCGLQGLSGLSEALTATV